jgi:catechol 2,3-dioxygenase-like lactoylglutathione lyase family enzyme
MKRFHVHLSVPDLAASIRFYSGMFGFEPTVEKPDYAKWMLDEPRVNFAISTRGGRTGLNHLGLQADSADELAEIRARFDAAERGAVVDEIGAHCCYAVSDKHWVRDPQGIAWEAFHSLGTIPIYEGGACGNGESACCAETDDAAVATTAPAAKSSGCCAQPAGATQREPVAASPTRACCG